MDVETFIRDVIKIRVENANGAKKRQPFIMFDYQEEFLKTILSEKMVLALKARQLGFTTIVMAYALWLMFFHEETNVLIISRSQPAANKNLLMLKQMYQFLPQWLKDRGPRKGADAAESFGFIHSDGSLSLINSMAPGDNTATGETASLVILDEFDLYKNVDPASVWNAIDPTLDSALANTFTKSAVCIIISTARNPDGIFYRLYKEGLTPEGRFKSLFVPATQSRFLWTDGKYDPSKYEAKKKERTAMGKPWLIYSEYPMTDEEAFRKSGESRYTDLPEFEEIVEYAERGNLYFNEVMKNYDLRKTNNGYFRINERPRKDRRYILSIDPATGRGKDFTVGQIHAYDEFGTPYIAAYWASNIIKGKHAAEAFYDIAKYYKGTDKEALVAVETTGGFGYSFIENMEELGHRRFYHHMASSGKWRKGVANAAGINTAGSSGIRNILIDKLGEVLPTMQGMYPTLLSELYTFVELPTGKVAANPGCHDDHVMCAAIGQYVLAVGNNAPVSVQDDEEEIPAIDKQMYDRIYADVAKARASQEKLNAKYMRTLSRRLSSRR